MSEYVVDASTAVKLYLPEAESAKAFALFGTLAAKTPSVLRVPDLFYSECGNIFWKHVQRGNCSASQAVQFEASLRAFPLVRTPIFDLSADSLNIALKHGITAYDACYVALAARHQVSLITANQKLIAKLAGTPLEPIWIGNWSP